MERGILKALSPIIWGSRKGAVARRKLLAMRVHVLTDGIGKVIGQSIGAIGFRKGYFRGGADDTRVAEVFNVWCHVVKRGIGAVVKVDDDYVFLAARCLEDAFYYFHSRAIDHFLFDVARKAGVEVANSMDCEGGKCCECSDVYEIKVIVAECRELRELRRVAGREVKQYAGYTDDGCELFVRDQLEEIFDKELYCVHDGSVAL